MEKKIALAKINQLMWRLENERATSPAALGLVFEILKMVIEQLEGE